MITLQYNSDNIDDNANYEHIPYLSYYQIFTVAAERVVPIQYPIEPFKHTTMDKLLQAGPN